MSIGHRTALLKRCMAIVAALLLAVSVSASSASADPPAGGMTGPQVNAMFDSYGDTAGRWAGGDSTASALLPDGRVAWLFSDTFVGPVNSDHSLPAGTKMVHNAIVVQDGSALTTTLTGGTAQSPTSLVDTGVASDFYWVGNGEVDGATLKVIYNRYHNNGGGDLDVTLTGSALAVFNLPALTLQSVTALPVGSVVAWGQDLVTDGGYTYIYGTETTGAGGMKFAHVARVPAGGLAGTWSFWNGSAWVADPADSTRLFSGVDSYSVQNIGGQFVAVTVDSNIPFNADVVAYTSPSPTGPFSGPVALFTAPEPGAANGKPVIVYDAHVHPELAPSGRLLVSYNVNSLRSSDVTADIRTYRPRFVDVAWPRPAPAPGVPAAPTALTATADSSGLVRLAWSAPAGMTFAVYQRDVTAGQTHPARLPNLATQNSIDVDYVHTGHLYEYQVAAINAAGEGPRSGLASVTPVITAPPAPTGLTAAAGTDGSVTLTWSAVPHVWRYDLLYRDVTAGETAYVSLVAPIGTDTTYKATRLRHQHQYDFVVTAHHGGGDSPMSTPATATAFYAIPGAPTGVTATSNADGTIRVSWTAPASGLFYWVYQRDVTAGATEFAKLPYPITSTSFDAGLLRGGHQYEYKVSGFNAGGEGPTSGVVSAVSTRPLPQPPTNLAATPTSSGAVLTWTASPTTGVWYNLYLRDVTAGEPNFTLSKYPITTCCTFTGGLLTNGHTYEFRLTAISSSGESTASNTVSVIPQPAPPGAVTNLAASPSAAGDGGVTLTWTPPSGDNLWFYVYQRDVTAGQTSFTKLGYPITTCCSVTIGSGVNANNHVYEYKMAAIGGGGEGPQSSVGSATAHYDPPPAPTNLRGHTSGNGSITLEWDYNGSSAYFWVYWRDVTANQATFTKSTFPTTSSTKTFTGLVNAHVYEYQVTADTPGGEGAASGTTQVTSYGGLPQPPTDLTGTAGDGSVTLNWSPSPTADVLYHVYLRNKTANGSFQLLPYPATCCTMPGGLLSNGTEYEFKVAAFNPSGESTATAIVTLKPMPPLPVAPTNLSASAGNHQVALSWTASTSPNVYYWLEIRSNGGAWQRQQYPISGCCAKTVTFLTNFTDYDFRLVAQNLSGYSPASGVASARPEPPVPAPPTNLAAAAGDGSVTLSWTASPTAEVYYWVEYDDGNDGGPWLRLPYPVQCCTETIQLLTNGTWYGFRLIATNGKNSVPSGTASARPMPPVPAAPQWVSATTWTENAERLGRVKVTWAPSSTPSAAYKVYFRNATRLQGWELAAVNYNFGSPLEWGWSYPTGGGERYEFKVEAFNLAGVATSPVASVMSTPTKRDIYLGFTGVVLYGWDYPIPQGLATFLAAKNAQSNWSRYNFNWTDNACSTPGNLGEILNPYEDTYRDACLRHDFGYRNHTPIEFELDEPSLKRRVDLTMRYDMRDLCFRDFPNVIDMADLMACLTISDVYYQAVDRFGWASWTATTADD